MAFKLTEETIQDLVTQVNEAYPAYQFDWQTYMIGNVQEGSLVESLIFLENKEWFALIFLAPLDVSKITNIKFIEKSEIQGLKFKKGLVNYVLKLRLQNGESLKILFHPLGGGKHCPIGKANIAQYQQRFSTEYNDKADMKDRNNGLSLKLLTGLGLVLMFVVAILFIFTTDSKLITIIGTLAFGFLYAMALKYGEQFIAKQKDKDFVAELQAIGQSMDTLDSESYYRQLKAVTHLPVTGQYQAFYYAELVKHAHLLGLDKEAEQYLALFPRRYSEGAEKMYQELINFMATPKEELNIRFHK
ncbi:hypothetical protein [Streptococcus moroccensis]|uniref:Uncharacterized protein n=1 Tax=Streptococcus moroccensis TaxID=1451356 RepID=A0ABT9YQL4_9STRE|nr:hypothetical protein [Streptococcus moroccensis]MDQ0222296.1 hypothetical protein [Streptococcus moroccensis]